MVVFMCMWGVPAGPSRDLVLNHGEVTFLNLEPSTKHVAQLVVVQLRLRGQDVTNELVSGVGNPNKPVLAQLCFRTPAGAS